MKLLGVQITLAMVEVLRQEVVVDFLVIVVQYIINLGSREELSSESKSLSSSSLSNLASVSLVK